MQIISSVNYTDIGNYLIIAGVVVLAVGVLGIILDVILDESWATAIAVLGCIAACVLVSVGFYSKSRRIEYTIRIGEDVTVSNLVDRYEIVSYHNDTDTWLVRDKEP